MDIGNIQPVHDAKDRIDAPTPTRHSKIEYTAPVPLPPSRIEDEDNSLPNSLDGDPIYDMYVQDWMNSIYLPFVRDYGSSGLSTQLLADPYPDTPPVHDEILRGLDRIHIETENDKEYDDSPSDADYTPRNSPLHGFSSRSRASSVESKDSRFHSRRSSEGYFPLEFPSISRHRTSSPPLYPMDNPDSPKEKRNKKKRNKKNTSEGNSVQLGDNSGITNKRYGPAICSTYNADLDPDIVPAQIPDMSNTVGLGLALDLEDELLPLPKEIQEGNSKQYEQASRRIPGLWVKDYVAAANIYTIENIFGPTLTTINHSNTPENYLMPLDSKGKDTGKGKEKEIGHSAGCTKPISSAFSKLDNEAGTSTLFQGFCTCAVGSLCHSHLNPTASSSKTPPRPTNREYSEDHDERKHIESEWRLEASHDHGFYQPRKANFGVDDRELLQYTHAHAISDHAQSDFKSEPAPWPNQYQYGLYVDQTSTYETSMKLTVNKTTPESIFDSQCQSALIGARSRINCDCKYDHDQSTQLSAPNDRLPPMALTMARRTTINAGFGWKSAALVASSHMHAYADKLQHYHYIRRGYNHELIHNYHIGCGDKVADVLGTSLDKVIYGKPWFLASSWTNVACHIIWDKSQFNAHSAKLTVKHSDTFGDFEGHDTISIFSKSASLEEKFDGVHPWNSRIELPMQRYHLPLIGRILSPGDEGLCIVNIPTSTHVIQALSAFLFQTRIFIPPSSLGEHGAPDRPLPPSNSTDYTTFTRFGPLRKQISDWLLVNFDFALVCSLISHWFGFSSRKTVLKKDTPPLVYHTLKQQSTRSKSFRDGKINLERGVISNPYQVFPRRLWDLKVNRVIPTYLLMLPWTSGSFPDYVAISHSWVEASEREYIYSSINGNSWAIPIPKGTDFHHIRNEVLGHFPSIQYCWLDVLCLRQPPSPNDPINPAPLQSQWLEALELGPDCNGTHKHEKESLLDIPTIGNIYKGAAGVLRYLNGLGKVFRQSEWDHENHWLNRSWTLQESIGLPVHGGLCESCINPLNTLSPWRGTRRRLRDCLEKINQIIQGINNTPSMMALIKEMSQRYAAQEIDKIAGLSYLLRFQELPTYSKNEETEDAWERCLKSAPETIIAELFFNCPFSGLFGILPTWQEVTSCSGALARLHMLTKSSIEIFRKINEQNLNSKRANNQVFRGVRFFGHLLHGCILRNNPKDENYYLAAHARSRAQFPDMVMTLKFFLGYQVDIKLSDDQDTMYQLFTHSLAPCSSWVVLNEGTKIGVLCSDENFGILHVSEIIEEGLLVVDTRGSIEVFGRD